MWLYIKIFKIYTYGNIRIIQISITLDLDTTYLSKSIDIHSLKIINPPLLIDHTADRNMHTWQEWIGAFGEGIG